MSRGFLLDTNIPSELTRPQTDARVAQWLEDTDDNLMHISVITIGEVCKGITVHQEAHRRAWLRQWLENDLRPWFAGRILPVLGGHLKTGHSWTLQKRPTEPNQNKTIYTSRVGARANIFDET